MDTSEIEVREALAACFRLIAHYGWDDLIFTHATARIPDTEYLLINAYGLRFDEITASNLLKIDLEGNIISGDGILNPAGLVIHSAIHSSRKDAGCVIHLHTKEAMAVATDRDGLWPVTQRAMSCLVSLAYHGYHGLVVDENEKPILVNDLGDKKNLILRNHGILSVGSCVEEAMSLIRSLQVACETQVLIDRNRAVPIPQSVLNNFHGNRTKGLGGGDKPYMIVWDAMYRLVKQKYPEYKL